MDDAVSNAPDVPRLAVNNRSTGTVTPNLPYQFFITLRREPDSCNEPCVFKWDLRREEFHRGHFDLIRESDGASDKVDIEMPFHQHDHRQLLPGQKYRLIWTEADIEYWAWGSLSELDGGLLQYKASPRLVLPASKGFAFMVKEEKPHWAGREEAESRFDHERAEQMELARRNDENYRRRLASLLNDVPSPDRQQSDPGALKFVIKLEVPSELFFDRESTITAHIRLDDRRPVTFQTYLRPRFLLGRSRRHARSTLPLQHEAKEQANETEWIPCPSDESTGFMIVDDPDVHANVAESNLFVSLQPGDSHSSTYRLQSPLWNDFPIDATAEDHFCVRFTGVELDWWDWGDAEDQGQTKITLPCFLHADVLEPRDNDGRPVARAPASDCVQFAVEA
ncbi:hypothetical protein S40288_10885 [Stachybotrys chartarum IBT 40288]|nr:hypothetical protein S40288_10885 [Stachybotrys chartarum IBT 40288]